jgi:hypothetical protein
MSCHVVVQNIAGGRQKFPDHFIEALRHPNYNTPIRSVKVIALTKDEDAYVELRTGSKIFWKYKGGYEAMRVYGLPPKTRTSKGKFICWLVRRFYKRKEKDNGQLQTVKEARAAAMPAVCQGQKLFATFHNGQVVRFKESAKNMDISHNWIICETNADTRNPRISNICVMPAHLAKIVADPDNPRKTISLKKTEGVMLALNEFMWALGYEPPTKDNELPHPPSVKP